MTRFAKSVISSAAAACLCFGTIAVADNPQPSGAADQPRTSQGAGATDAGQADARDSHRMMMEQLQKADTPDKLFLLKAAMGCEAENQWAQVAQQKSQNVQVKQVAEAIIKDHDQMTQSLRKVIEQQGLQMPQGISPFAQQELKVARSLPAEQFDQRFLSCVKASQAVALSACEDESKIATDAGVKEFASQGLASLQQRSQGIQQAAVAVGLPSGTEAQQAGQRISPSGIERK